MQKIIILFSLIIFVLNNLSGQSKIDRSNETDNDLTQFSQTIKKAKTDHVKLLVNISGGELNIKKTASHLAKVDFNYHKAYWKPTVSYTENEQGGKLQVKAFTNGDEQRIKDHNICALQINPDIKYSLGIVIGAGLANIDFSDFNIDKGLFKLGVGSFNINLSNTSIPLLKVEAGIGEVTIDLSGKWKNNLNAKINAGIGELKIIVPENEGVKFTISGFLGDINTPGYDKNDKVYTNEAYYSANNKLEFTINGAIGSITIIEK